MSPKEVGNTTLKQSKATPYEAEIDNFLYL